MKQRFARSLRPIVEPLEDRLPLAAGDLDPTFARFSADPGIRGGEFVFSAVANLPGGRLLAVGSGLSDSPTSRFDDDFRLVAIQPDGDLDTSWGQQGWSTVAFNLDGFRGHNMDTAAGVAIQRDGKIVVVGTAYKTTINEVVDADIAVCRLNPDGSLDTSFGSGGKRTFRFDRDGPGKFNSDIGTAVAIQPDGKILIGGQSSKTGAYDPEEGANRNDFDFAFIRLSPDGSLDTTFDGDGIRFVDLDPAVASSDTLIGLSVQSDGRIVAAGSSSYPSALRRQGRGDDLTVIRLLPDGALDPGFAIAGIGRVGFDPDLGPEPSLISDARLGGLALQPDGKIVLAGGQTVDSPSERHTNLVLARFNPDGSLDQTFDGDGRLKPNLRWPDGTPADRRNSFASEVAVQVDGQIVVTGSMDNQSGFWFEVPILLRLNPDGTPDSAFSGDGLAPILWRSNVSDFGEPISGYADLVVIQPDGRILVGGHRFWNGPNQTLVTSSFLARVLVGDLPPDPGSPAPTPTIPNPTPGSNPVATNPEIAEVSVLRGRAGSKKVQIAFRGPVDPALIHDVGRYELRPWVGLGKHRRLGRLLTIVGGDFDAERNVFTLTLSRALKAGQNVLFSAFGTTAIIRRRR